MRKNYSKKTILFALAMLICMTSYAQKTEENKESKDGKYGKFDMEIGFQSSILTSRSPGDSYTVYPFFFLESRWQLKQQPINVGLSVSASQIVRHYEGFSDKTFRTIPIMAIADYQFGRGKKVNPYVGLGVGISLNQNDYDPFKTYFAATPRIGVRFFKFMNLQVGYLLTLRDYSRMYVNLGFYF